jgi:hypothetical protein
MLRTLLGFAAITTLAATPASLAAQTPDYLAFGDYAREVARTLTSIRSCKRMGFDVDDGPSLPNEVSNLALRAAITMGIDRSTAESLLLDALDRENEDIELMSSVPEHIDTTEELVALARETFAFWDRRCRSLASGGFGSAYVRLTGDEERVQRKALEELIRGIEAAASGQE